MSRYIFPMQKLMDYKEILLNEEISRIQHFNKQISDCEENIENVTRRMENLCTAIDNKNTVLSVGVMVSYKRYINDLRGLKTSFNNQKEGFERLLEISKSKAMSLQKEHKTINALKDKKYEEYKKEQEKKEQSILDDLVSAKRVN